MFKVNIGKDCVYEDNIAFTVVNVVARFAWYGHVFNLVHNDPKLFIPAIQPGCKWFLDNRDLTDHSATIRFKKDDDTQSYFAIHYNNRDAVPAPVNYGMTIPEFLGTYLTLTIEDTGCRVKTVLHPMSMPLEIDNYVIKFKKLKGKAVEFEIHSDDTGMPGAAQ